VAARAAAVAEANVIAAEVTILSNYAGDRAINYANDLSIDHAHEHAHVYFTSSTALPVSYNAASDFYDTMQSFLLNMFQVLFLYCSDNFHPPLY
jgi:hypothetical protein